MTPEAQRIVIAEACGFTFPADMPEMQKAWVGFFKGAEEGSRVPDFLHDLNAMAEALQKLDDTVNTIPEDVGFETQRDAYICNIEKVVGRDCAEEDIYWHALNATASQRAESFLRTLGLWQEGQGE